MSQSDVHLIECVATLRNSPSLPFVLIGGVAMIVLGSERTTSDVDIFVPESSVLEISSRLLEIPGFHLDVKDGGERRVVFHSNTNGETCPIDVLTSAVDGLTYRDLSTNVRLFNGVNLLPLDFSLAVKMTCFYYRAEDDNGLRKRVTDAQDMFFFSFSDEGG